MGSIKSEMVQLLDQKLDHAQQQISKALTISYRWIQDIQKDLQSLKSNHGSQLFMAEEKWDEMT